MVEMAAHARSPLATSTSSLACAVMSEDVRDLALEFDQLVDDYIAVDRWDEVREMEQRFLLAYGNVVAMRQVIDDYTEAEFG